MGLKVRYAKLSLVCTALMYMLVLVHTRRPLLHLGVPRLSNVLQSLDAYCSVSCVGDSV